MSAATFAAHCPPADPPWTTAVERAVGVRVVRDQGWPELLAALTRAIESGWQWRDRLPKLMGQAQLPWHAPAAELYLRLLVDSPRAALCPTTAEINGYRPEPSAE